MPSKSKTIKRAKTLKRRFDVKLRPVKLMLLSQRNSMSADEWNRFVTRTMDSILKNPAEYLGDEVPSPEVTQETIRYVFEGFFEDIKVRDVQVFRKRR